MIIWLQGPSGAGKTTVGRGLAAMRGLPFIDLDEEIEREQGRSILDIFWSDGEAAFRRMEWNLLLAIVEGERCERGPKVISLGGGAVLDPAIRTMMRSTGVRLFLDVDPDVAMSRLESDTPRPLLYDEDPLALWRKLYRQRRRLYEDTDATIDANAGADAVIAGAAAAVASLEDAAWSYSATLAGESCRVRCYRAVHPLVRELIATREGARALVIIDKHINQFFGEELTGQIVSDGDILQVIDASEEEKSLRNVEGIIAGLPAAGFGRDGVVIGIGGGVVTDLAGFIASIYMRGVRAIYLPTTLLAQVDAAIGGKTAVNAAGVRNLLGTIRQPSDVLIGTAFLRSLPPRELRSGFVESLKMGIANSAELDAEVERALPAIVEGELPDNINEVIRLSVRAKLDVVERDTRDTSLRLSLNLGHTFGHALEAAEPGVYAHGEAVAFGLMASAAMARMLGKITSERSAAIIARSRPFTHAAPAPPSIPAILRAMRSDKKRSGEEIRFVLPREETGFEIYPTDEMALITSAIEEALAEGMKDEG